MFFISGVKRDESFYLSGAERQLIEMTNGRFTIIQS